jgi:phospholipase C
MYPCRFHGLWVCFVTAGLLSACGGGHSAGTGSSQGTPQTLTLAVSGTGSVTSNPPGINCPTECSASFASNTLVTVTASPAANSFFGGWSGAGCTGTDPCKIQMNAPQSVAANFNSGAVLTVAVSGSGVVTSSPAGINCPGTCSAAFPQNTQVTLSETPAANNTFRGWSGACSGTASCSLTLNAATSVTASFGVPGSLQSLNHIIFLLQENRSFDHYFGAMREYWAQNGITDQPFDGLPQFNPPANPALAPTNAGCDPTQPPPAACVADPSVPVPSFHMASVCNEEPSPFWNEAHIDWDYTDPLGLNPAALNGFVQAGANDARQTSPPFNDVNGYRVMGYFDGNDLNFYYFMASNFATSDRWFAPAMNRTQINRMYLLGATSAGHVYPLASSAVAIPNKTIFENLQDAGISWKIYVNPQGTGCADTDSSCLLNFTAIGTFTYGHTVATTPSLLQNIVSISQYTTDTQNGTLPQVALIANAGAAALDEHPASNIQNGAQYVEGLINTLMTSPSWNDSAMILTFDEPGGFYDHVSPQPMPSPDGIQPLDLQPNDICSGPGQIGTGTCDFTWTGYRVPLIVVSPFAKRNYVSHTVRDYTAILNLIEERFGVPALTKRDAAQAPMDEFFDFVNVPWAIPPTPPAQNTSGQCSLVPPTP